MLHYLASFIVYTLAMVGILILGFVVYKKTVVSTPARKNSFLKIVDVLHLPDRKSIYLINCKNEQFLIASSNENICLLSKIDSKKEYVEKYLKEKETVKEKTQDKQVIRSLLKELSDRNKLKRDNY
ncbi:MAG: flagellar biosynthetic protein FliO [Candidatus Gastranaerophilales bacterium]|nr:flagellar biosynthetic protein FliO [Candidatus Gastranaerophilales bacterium]